MQHACLAIIGTLHASLITCLEVFHLLFFFSYQAKYDQNRAKLSEPTLPTTIPIKIHSNGFLTSNNSVLNSSDTTDDGRHAHHRIINMNGGQSSSQHKKTSSNSMYDQLSPQKPSLRSFNSLEYHNI